jgi:LysM repeat protein
MTLYTQAQVRSLAQSVGFTAAQAEIAAAIAMAESLTFKDGKQYADFSKVGDIALQNETYGPSYGAWQVRSLKAQWGTGLVRDGSRLPDPTFNAKSALAIFRSQGWNAWSTYTSGAYKGYMLDAVYNPKPVLPAGTYMVTGGDYLSKIGANTGYDWKLIAAINNLKSPYTIYPGQVLLLPDWLYTVKAGDNLTLIANKYAKVTWQRIAEYNKLANPNVLSIGQPLRIPRYTSWDGTTLGL